MRKTSLILSSSLALPLLFACGASHEQQLANEETQTEDGLRGPGRDATDARVPELGDDLNVLSASRISMADGLAKAEAENGPVIEAKFELDSTNHLSLSIYPVTSLDLDSERNVFQELAGDPSVRPFSGSLETFADQEHLTRSSRDLTLIQLSRRSLAGAVHEASESGLVFWAIPTILRGRAGYGVYTYNGRNQRYRFIDGRGPGWHPWIEYLELEDGPGDGASDARTPELGEDLGVLASSKLSMASALEQIYDEHGPAIEAKFELGDDGKLSLSIYPVGKGIDIDAERNTFFELAGDPTADAYEPSISEFTAPDAEHLTRSARDLTIVQIANLSLLDAVYVAEAIVPDGFVYWAIPTIRDRHAGYGVYVRDADGAVHYLFID